MRSAAIGSAGLLEAPARTTWPDAGPKSSTSTNSPRTSAALPAGEVAKMRLMALSTSEASLRSLIGMSHTYSGIGASIAEVKVESDMLDRKQRCVTGGAFTRPG